MKLTTQDADQYYNLMWSLLRFVNHKMDILPDIATADEYKVLPISEKLKIRDALYDNIALVDTYLVENPQNLSPEDLEIVRSWKEFVRGDFFIERMLKKYTVFIGGEKVYGVLALYETFEDLLPYMDLPYYTKAVLLPFKGKIIFDGLLQGYAISFGGGIKSDLKETYSAAKQNRKIIESFDPQAQVKSTVKDKKQIKVLGSTLDEMSKQAKALRSSSGSPAIQSPANSMVKASIEFAKLAVENPDDIDELWKAFKKVERAIRRAETVLFRAEPY